MKYVGDDDLKVYPLERTKRCISFLQTTLRIQKFKETDDFRSDDIESYNGVLDLILLGFSALYFIFFLLILDRNMPESSGNGIAFLIIRKDICPDGPSLLGVKAF